MNYNINLLAFGTFGNPHGFRQTFFIGNGELAKSVKTFDLNTNAIKLFPNSRVYAIRKEYAGGFNTIAYAVYSYAKEQNSDRSGTFIGSSILFIDKIAEESIVVDQLNEFQENLISKNVQNDVIIVNHSDQLSVIKPKDFDKTESCLKSVEDLNFVQNSNKYLVVFCETSSEKLGQFFRKSVDLLNVYDTIYFTNSREVAEFVNQKGIFKVIQSVGEKDELEKEMQNLFEERKRKIDSSISEFEKEKKLLEEDRKRLIEEYKEQIERNEKLHQENKRKIDESKSDLDRLNKFYSEFLGKINDLANQLRSGEKLDNVKNLYKENKRLFVEGVNQLKKPTFVNNIAKASAKSGLRVESPYTNNEYIHQYNGNSEEKQESKIDTFKVAAFVLSLLLIGTWVYFIFFTTRKDAKSVEAHQQGIVEKHDSIPAQTIPEQVQELTPEPNTELNENDYRLVAKKLKYGLRIDDVTKIIFDKNPTDIKSNYAGQENIYEKKIIELNKNCFEEKEGVFYFSKDSLIHIPAYKELN